MDDETIRLYKGAGEPSCARPSPRRCPMRCSIRRFPVPRKRISTTARSCLTAWWKAQRPPLANGIPVGLGNDVGCPYITQYDFWRELCYFHKYCGVSNRFALYTATLRNAQLAGVGDVTGSIEPGKSADFIVTKHDPLERPACAAASGTGGLPGPCDQKSRTPSGTKRWMPCWTRIWHKTAESDEKQGAAEDDVGSPLL